MPSRSSCRLLPDRLLRISLAGLILLLAAALRFCGLDWDGGIAAHPDERYIVGVTESMRWPHRLNPFDLAPDFAYGHLPLYLLALAVRVAGGVNSLLVGRVLAASLDLGTVALTYVLGRRLYGDKVGLLSAGFVALTASHVQQAHFYTADVALAFFSVGALLFAARLAEMGRCLDACWAGGLAGLATGAKSSALVLAMPLGAACLVCPPGRIARWKRGLLCAGAALAAFGLTNPFAVLECAVLWRNVAQQAAIARGVLDVPYTRQFHGTWPYLYPIVQQLRWGMGWLLGIAAFGGLFHAVWRAVREPPRRAEWVALAWVLPNFAFTAALYAKFPRYLLPLTPVLAIYGARWLCALTRPKLRLSACAVVVVAAFIRSVALVAMYRTDHPWLTASQWLYRSAPAGSVVAVEAWDHPLPLDGAHDRAYDVRTLPIFDADVPEKWERVECVLTDADYVAIASRRGYATLARWPERYPLTARYYRRLFEGELGFEPVACFWRAPRLGPLVLADDPAADLGFSLPEFCLPHQAPLMALGRLDESFVVYDHPRVIILRRVP